MASLLSIPITGYYSIDRLALIYFSFVQQDHKLNGIDIKVKLAVIDKSA
jgi:hypothetical protein